MNHSTDTYPCVYGFEYLILSSLLWLCFLPLWIPALFGNCWRQCFCCFCDPIVLLGTIIDFVKVIHRLETIFHSSNIEMLL